MALHINKDRSNLDSHDKTLAAENFVNSILDGLDIKSDKNTSSSNDDGIFYEWDSSYKAYEKTINDIASMMYYYSNYE